MTGRRRRYRLDDWPPACDHQVGLCSGCRDECGECGDG